MNYKSWQDTTGDEEHIVFPIVLISNQKVTFGCTDMNDPSTCVMKKK